MTALTGEESASSAGASPASALVPLKSRKVGGGTATAVLLGSAAAIALGTMLAGPAEPLSGSVATSAAGSVSRGIQVELTGQAITGAQTSMSAPLATTPLIGGNVAGHEYFSSQLLLINIVQNGGWDPHSWLQAGTLVPLAGDANGDPPTDFRVPPHYVQNPHGVVQVMHAQCTGWIDTIATSDGQITISNKQFAGNSTTFDITFAATWPATPQFWYLNCTGTRRIGGPTGTPNTGVIDFQIAAPGYTVADIATKRWTDEAVTYFQTVTSVNGPLRTMDLQTTNFSPVVNFSELSLRATTKIGSVTYEDMIDLANRTGRPLHMQAGFHWSDACITSFVQLVESRLNPSLHIYFGFSNEHWNPSFTQNHDSIKLACVELKGFVGTEGNRSFSATRSANIVTFTSQGDDHLWTTGQSLYFFGFDGVPGELVVTNITVTGPKTATFQRSGADGVIFVGSGQRVIGNLNSNLRLTTTYPGDTIDPYYLAERLCMRRTKEMSDLVRAVVGDAAMQTRWRITWEDQGFQVNPDDPFRNIVLYYLKNKWTARAVNEYVYRWDYAPYFYHDPYKEAAGATVAQVVGALQTNCGLAKTDYYFELRKAVAIQDFGIQTGCYEGGADTKSFTLNGADLQVRCAAQFDPGIQAPMETMLADWFRTGAGAFEWYTLGFLNATDANRDAVWGITNELTNLTAPKIAALVNIKNNPPAMSRNAVPGVLDGRTVWCGAYASTTYGNLSSYVGHLRALLFVQTAGTYTIRLRYTCNQPGRAANIRVNRNLASGSPYAFTNQGTGVSHDTLRGANGAGTLLLPDITATLNAGVNAIDIARTANQGDDVEFYSVQVV